MSTPYRRAKFIVESNARKQAIGDARTLEEPKVAEALDPAAPANLIPTLRGWVRGAKGQMIFRGLAQPDYLALTNEQNIELQDYWIEQYLRIVKEELQTRIGE